jgi:MFS family permease
VERGGSVAARTGRLHFSVFFASVGIAYVYLIPAYAEQLGAGYPDLGLIGTVRSLPYTFLPVIAGYLGDRFGRRRLYLLSIFAVGPILSGFVAQIAGPDFALLVLAVVAFSAIPVVAFSGRDAATREVPALKS